MHLELAKELLNAGFPNIQDLQHRQGREFLTPDCRVSFYSLGELALAENWFIPTLEELIAACEKKEGYDHFSLTHRQIGWFASIEAQDEQPHRVSHQATAEDAVACLWLALEKRRHGGKWGKYSLPDGALGRGLVEALMSSAAWTARKYASRD